ncbi:uncharacterized protein LOC131537205 [Onychostoma macrolepis]|uniref:uncharacterized protein LOC131537205 n=1 Tax=Onychostoma macrolepis TaxID=369639 RepID=UPI00272CEEEE|nr:uncharacterized protein LOC131537205 [Onychostoma macrolepis]XP_058626490.1 uncharacterized protein LOC131537205 [Onychostoma macrolepis]
MDERAFHQKIREAFPIIGEGEIEICRVDRRRRVIPVQLSSVCPAAIKACPVFGRSAVYVRLKNTSRLAAIQHESSNEDPICGTREALSIQGTSDRDHRWRHVESLEQRRRQKIAERRAHVSRIAEPEQGIAIQLQYPDGTRRTRNFVVSQPIQDLFAFAGSDDMASEIFRLQLSWSSNTILSTVDGSLSDHEIRRPSTLYVLWMSGAQIEGLIESSVESSTDQPATTQDLGSCCSPSAPTCEVYALDSEDEEEDVVMLTSPVYSNHESDDDVTAADIIRTFQKENINLEEKMIVVARRRKVLHSACTALKSSYFAWHKSPQIEFVGESADD